MRRPWRGVAIAAAAIGRYSVPARVAARPAPSGGRRKPGGRGGASPFRGSLGCRRRRARSIPRVSRARSCCRGGSRQAMRAMRSIRPSTLQGGVPQHQGRVRADRGRLHRRDGGEVQLRRDAGRVLRRLGSRPTGSTTASSSRSTTTSEAASTRAVLPRLPRRVQGPGRQDLRPARRTATRCHGLQHRHADRRPASRRRRTGRSSPPPPRSSRPASRRPCAWALARSGARVHLPGGGSLYSDDKTATRSTRPRSSRRSRPTSASSRTARPSARPTSATTGAASPSASGTPRSSSRVAGSTRT